MKRAYVLMILVSFAAVGGLTGWMVGLSNTPVVATILPIIFSIFGAVSYAAVERRLASEENVAPKLGKLNGQSLAAPAIWSAGVTILCISTYYAAQVGMSVRVPHYPRMENWIKSTNIKPADYTVIYNIRWKLQSAGVTEAEAHEFFDNVVGSALQEKNDLIRYDSLTDVQNNLVAPTKSWNLANQALPAPPANRPS